MRASPARSRLVLAYGAVAVLTVAALLAHFFVLPGLGVVAPLLPFIPAILFGAWLGGLGPGLAATLFGAAAGAWVFLSPDYAPDRIAFHQWLRLFLFVSSGAVISVIIEQMHRARRRAERLADERRGDILRLERATRALEDADRRKDAFLATLAHELRNPLAPIWNAVEILGRAESTPERLDDARRVIERQVRHMVRLVDDLMDVSRITRDRLELRRETVDLGRVVRHAAETVAPQAEQAGVRMRVELSGEALTVLADPVRLGQVLTNVLSNAIKYSYRGGLVSLALDRRGDDAVITVRDEGIGFDAADADTLFEMFSQSSPAMDHASSGLGIGLWLARRLMALHGGTIAAESTGRGKGSRFTLHLPLQPGAPDGAAPRPRSEGAPAQWRVLVVDDNADNAATLAELLRAGGHAVDVAHDGEAALAAIGQLRPDVVLLDIGLPRLDGYAVCRRVRAEAGGDRLAILAMTGWGQAEDRRRSADAGFDAHLVKPVDFEQLGQAIALACAQRGLRPGA